MKHLLLVLAIMISTIAISETKTTSPKHTNVMKCGALTCSVYNDHGNKSVMLQYKDLRYHYHYDTGLILLVNKEEIENLMHDIEAAARSSEAKIEKEWAQTHYKLNVRVRNKGIYIFDQNNARTYIRYKQAIMLIEWLKTVEL